jgi:hypothetical protein
MLRTLFYCGAVLAAASCKQSAPATVDAATPVLAASVTAADPMLDASSAHVSISDAGDIIAASHGKVVAVSDSDARTFAAPFLGDAQFAHPVFAGNFGPSPRTMFGITQTDTMSPYASLVVAFENGAWKKIETEPLVDAMWAGWQIDAVLFEDIDGNGILAPIVIAEYMTGIGPTGAQPFVVVSVYRWHSGKMMRATDIEKILIGAQDSAAIRGRLARRKVPKNPPL